MSTCCTTRGCCGNVECRRKAPILVRRESFTGRWVAITRHTHQGSLVRASEKHVLDAVSQAEIELRGSVLSALFETVRDRYETAVEGSEAEAAYRVATDGTPHANSCLYAAAWRAVKAMGYRRLITYTQAGETGASLRGAGWRVVAVRPPRKGWDMPGRPRVDRHDTGIQRTLWEAS